MTPEGEKLFVLAAEIRDAIKAERVACAAIARAVLKDVEDDAWSYHAVLKVVEAIEARGNGE
jgi:hypothetical protein